MARPPVTTIRELAPLLRSRAPVSATELARALGVNRATIGRVLSGFGSDLITMGAARATRYALRRDIRGAGNQWPVYRINEQGRASEWARLEAVHERLWRVRWSIRAPEWAGHFMDRGGIWSGFPFFLSDLRPQGFLGRTIARRVSRTLQVPEDPRLWSDDDIVVFMQSEGGDLSGDLILGDDCLRRALAGILEGAVETETRYPELAILASIEPPGSSVGGEHPKFATSLANMPGGGRDVLVKFSPPMDQAAGRRWADLLLGEWHAHVLLSGIGLATPGARILDLAGRRFLEVPRFDRTPAGGRRGIVQLESLHAAAVGSHSRGWSAAMEELRLCGLTSHDAVETAQRLQAFGELIGNTDMHFGNLSLWLDDTLPFRIGPCYDMLPMLWAPTSQGELMERVFTPLPPVPAAMAAWRAAYPLALEFWRNLAADERLSAEFAGFARSALDTLCKLRQFTE